MTELSTVSDSATVPVPDSRSYARRLPRRRAVPELPAASPAYLTACLSALSRSVTRVHATHACSNVARDLDQRLTSVITELESLVHDLLHEAGPAAGLPAPPPGGAASDGGRCSEQSRAEAAFEAWLTSGDRSDVWPIDAPDEPQMSLTTMLGELVLAGRQLTAGAAAELGMPPGTTHGHAATELLLAVNDAAGPRCRSYRSALYYLRDHDDALVSQ